VYLLEYDMSIGVGDDLIMFSQAMSGYKPILWYNSIRDKLDLMVNN
jgi:hypothetical protein